jgi:hypothetical protein
MHGRSIRCPQFGLVLQLLTNLDGQLSLQLSDVDIRKAYAPHSLRKSCLMVSCLSSCLRKAYMKQKLSTAGANDAAVKI